MFDLKPIATVFRRLGAGIDATAGALRSRFRRRSEPLEALAEPPMAEQSLDPVAADEPVQLAPVSTPARKSRKTPATKRAKAVAKPAKKSAAKKKSAPAAKAAAKEDAPKAPARRKAAKPKAAPAA